MTFITKLLEALAWPIAIVTLAFFLRRPLISLLPLVESLQIRGVKIKFRKDIEEARTYADKIPRKQPQSRYKDKGLNKANELAFAHPPAAIIEAWKVVEAELRKLAERADRKNLVRSPVGIFQDLQKHSRVTIGPTAESLFHCLRAIRNEAAHSSNIVASEGQALEYVDMAESLVGLMRGLGIDRKGA